MSSLNRGEFQRVPRLNSGLFTVYYSLLSITAGSIRIARVTARAAARATANSNTTAGNAIIDISVPFTPYGLKIETRWGLPPGVTLITYSRH